MSGRVGVLGLGIMGSAFASRLLEAGFEVWVHNRSAARARSLLASGAHWAASGDALADEVHLLITMISDDVALRDVTTGASGILRRTHPGLVWADMSTVSPSASAEVAEDAAAVDVLYLRAPVTGSKVQAEAGDLGILASGPAPALDAFHDVFAVLGRRVFWLGAGDEARVMKLAVNTLVAQSMLALSEALVFGQKAGLGWQTMLDVFRDGPVASPLVQYKADTLAERDFTAAFTASSVAKDLDLALNLARDTGATMPVTALSHQLFRAVCGLGWGDQDLSAAVLMYERFAGADEPTERR